ncbi:hypothetical protein ACFLYA_02490, partial [Candidatus Dependentiae bacterium]
MKNKNDEKRCKIKRFMRNLAYLVLAFLTMGALKTILGKHAYVCVSRESKFRKFIRMPKHNLAIAMFYDSEKNAKCCDAAMYAQLEDLKKMFKNASKIFKYEDAGVLFISVNLSLRKNESLRDMYQIGSTPVFVLFEDGEIYKDEAKREQILCG